MRKNAYLHAQLVTGALASSTTASLSASRGSNCASASSAVPYATSLINRTELSHIGPSLDGALPRRRALVGTARTCGVSDRTMALQSGTWEGGRARLLEHRPSWMHQPSFRPVSKNNNQENGRQQRARGRGTVTTKHRRLRAARSSAQPTADTRQHMAQIGLVRRAAKAGRPPKGWIVADGGGLTSEAHAG